MRLLAAVDVREGAEQVVEEVGRWADALGAVVDLAFIEEYGSTAALIRDPAIRSLVEKEWVHLRSRHVEQVGKLLGELPEACRGRCIVLAGVPSQELVSLAADYDGVCVGTHGRTGWGHFLLGSVAERVVRTSTVPVLVLRLKGT